MSDVDWKTGRALFTDAHYGIDLSGRDFQKVYLTSPGTLSHTFLNGATILDSAFFDLQLDQTELAEAEVIDCKFRDVDLTGTSFIGAIVADTLFICCNFSDGEWRQSRFSNVKFINCNFNYTTINSCTFENCEFSGDSSKGIDHRSVNYNVFFRCKFDIIFTDEAVSANNFGTNFQGNIRSIANYGENSSLEELCLKSATGNINGSDVVVAVESEACRPRTGKLRKSRLEFLTKIATTLSRGGFISATSLICIENIFLSMSKFSENEDDMLSTMSSVLAIRSALFDTSEQNSTSSERLNDAECVGLDIYYKEVFSFDDAVNLIEALGEIACNDSMRFKITSFRHGSTLIETMLTSTLSVGSVLMACNFVLKQATITLTEAGRLRTVAKNLVSRPSQTPARNSRKRSKLPAIRHAGAVAPEMVAVKNAVKKSGKKLAQMDSSASVTIHYASNK